ncbi:ABC transporter ATP-binding protein [uncultured Gemmiger sp.]|uniref:ABC transporter ATP-binding protein n=1 Tax=uncultured Gemmiger sp. TaxID=1623490 RepID=UPI0025E893DB|nr:ABC transporter ATP-binding protein [uncultured Gemmiger sp.]
MAEQTALSMQDVVFRYMEQGKRNILDHVNLDIPAGSVTVLMGAGGCGKSTLAAVAAGLYPENGGVLAGGNVFWFGRALTGMDPQQRARQVGMLFQNPDLQFCMDTLREEMRFCMENLCLAPDAMDPRIDAAAAELGVQALLDQPLHTLSGGEKQRAALACLYVMESRCLLLDECFANLDRDAARQLMDLLQRMHRQGRTIIAIDHQPDLWLDTADEFILLGDGGRVAARGLHKGNLDRYRPLFDDLGLFYPSPPRPHIPLREERAPVLCFEGVSIVRGTVRQTLFRRRSAAGPLLLDNAQARFPQGAMTAVLGPSGCGKTTAFLAVLRRHAYAGRITLNGTDLAKIRRRELYRQVGIVFQNPANQFITQNVAEEVMASLRVWNPAWPEDACRAEADRRLEEYGLSRYRRYSPYMLSQGQQRRLAVLSVLCGGQKLLLLDEPTYGQDARSVQAIMAQLQGKVRAEGLSVIFITHDRALAAAWADKIYWLRGRRLEPVPAEEVLA